MKEYKLQLIIAGVAIVLVILIVISSSLSDRSATQPAATYTDVATVPTLPPARGAGIDVESTAVQTSKQEIEKLVDALPYSTSIVANGQQVSIRIPEAALQDFSWSLVVYFPNLDFLVPADSPNYETQKETFLAASAEVFSWIKQQGADPQNIIIIWGDTPESQSRAREWLQ